MAPPDPNKKFSDMNGLEAQAVFETAFKNVIIQNASIFGGGGGSPPGGGSDPPGGGGGTNPSGGVDTPGVPQSIGQSAIDSSLRFAGKIPDALKGAADVYNGSIQALEVNAGPVLDQYNELQRVYGGISLGFDDMEGSSKAVVGRLKSMKNFFGNVGGAGIDMAKKLGFTSNIISQQFESDGEAFNSANDALAMLEEQHASYISAMDKETLYKMATYTDALGINSHALAETLETQINLTGKAQTTILDDVARFAEGLHKSTGIPLKAISSNAVQIINDTSRLGDVTAEEATRIAATLGQLGQTYDSFSGVLDKFQEFGSSAETAGLISQITGGAVNLDAQELMYLASEEQEKFLPELRRSLLAGGFDKEAFLELSRAEQRQFENAISLDFNQTMALLDRQRSFSEEDIKKIQEDTKAKDESAGAVLERQMQIAPKAFEDASEQAAYFRQQSLIPLHDQLLRNAEAQSKLNSNIRDYVELTDQAAGQAAAKKGLQAVAGATTAAADLIDKPTKIGTAQLANVYQNVGQNQRTAQQASAELDAAASAASTQPAAAVSRQSQFTDLVTAPPSPAVDQSAIAQSGISPVTQNTITPPATTPVAAAIQTPAPTQTVEVTPVINVGGNQAQTTSAGENVFTNNMLAELNNQAAAFNSFGGQLSQQVSATNNLNTSLNDLISSITGGANNSSIIINLDSQKIGEAVLRNKYGSEQVRIATE